MKGVYLRFSQPSVFYVSKFKKPFQYICTFYPIAKAIEKEKQNIRFYSILWLGYLIEWSPLLLCAVLFGDI